jgi:hypothetical protein
MGPASNRDMTSTLVPAANPITSRTGFCGQAGWDCALVAEPRAAKEIAKDRQILHIVLLHFVPLVMAATMNHPRHR